MYHATGWISPGRLPESAFIRLVARFSVRGKVSLKLRVLVLPYVLMQKSFARRFSQL